MGKLNILQGGYTGKVGSTYGVRQHRKTYAKAVPFSHTPHNTAQTKAVKAFTALNRLSSVIAQKYFSFLNLSAQGMYKNNAVSKWLKPVIQNGIFEPEYISETIPQDGSLKIDSVVYDLESGTFTVQLTNTLDTGSAKNEPIFIAFFTGAGAVKWSNVVYGESLIINGTFDYSNFSSFYIVAFKSIPWFGKRKVKGFTLYANTDIIVVNGVWYITRQEFATAPYVIDGVLYLPAENASVVDSVLHINGY